MEHVQDILNSFPLSELEQLDMFGFNWLHTTIMRNELEVFIFLVKNRFNTSIKNRAGETPISMALRFQRWEFVRYLSREG